MFTILLLSTEGWLNGIAMLLLTIYGISISIFFAYKGKKQKAPLLSLAGLMLLLILLAWAGGAYDFIMILITGKNYDAIEVQIIMVLLATVPNAIAVILGTYLVTEIVIPKKKRILFLFSFILGIIWIILALVDPLGQSILIYPEVSGENLVDHTIVLFTPLFFVEIFGILWLLALFGIGFLIKGIQNEGVIRKKFLFISTAAFFIGFVVFFEFESPNIYFLIAIRALLVVSCWLFYLGLRQEPEKSEKNIREEIKLESGLFRLIKKPKGYTEEEISLYRDQMICLVCKGHSAGYDIYICPECKAFYCRKCAKALEDLENSCWACESPIDRTKPIKKTSKDDENENSLFQEEHKKELKKKNHENSR